MSIFGTFAEKEFLKDYLEFLENNEVAHEILDFDKCFFFADNYLLAIVFVYFKRANYQKEDLTSINFLLGLYLAHQIEEELESFQVSLSDTASSLLKISFDDFKKKKNELFAAFNYRGIVSKEYCDEIMATFPNHFAWKRKRQEDHGGYYFFQKKRCCPKCMPYMKEHIDFEETDEDIVSAQQVNLLDHLMQTLSIQEKECTEI